MGGKEVLLGSDAWAGARACRAGWLGQGFGGLVSWSSLELDQVLCWGWDVLPKVSAEHWPENPASCHQTYCLYMGATNFLDTAEGGSHVIVALIVVKAQVLTIVTR